MTPVEIRAYQTSFPLYFAVNRMRYVPRAYREGNIPYEGVKNPIPLERMKDPETGDFYPLADIKVRATLLQLRVVGDAYNCSIQSSLILFRNIKRKNI